MNEIPESELRALQREYLMDVREKVLLIRKHGEALGDQSRFKSSFPILLFLAHQLKGSGGSLGFPDITDLARRMGEQLNGFLDDAAPRPSPAELSRTVLATADDLDQVVTSGEATL